MAFEEQPSNDNNRPRLPAAGERRASPRQRVLLSGKLAYLPGALTADCAIRNLSPDGALVLTTTTTALPRDPFLIVTARAVAHKARTAWRDGERCGLAFEATWPLDTKTPAAFAGLRDLWLDLLPH